VISLGYSYISDSTGGNPTFFLNEFLIVVLDLYIASDTLFAAWATLFLWQYITTQTITIIPITMPATAPAPITPA